MRGFPEWWDWELVFVDHFYERAEERGITELEVRAMLERPKGLERNHEEGRFVVHVRHRRSPWYVIVEPNFVLKELRVLTAYPRER